MKRSHRLKIFQLQSKEGTMDICIFSIDAYGITYNQYKIFKESKRKIIYEVSKGKYVSIIKKGNVILNHAFNKDIIKALIDNDICYVRNYEGDCNLEYILSSTDLCRKYRSAKDKTEAACREYLICKEKYDRFAGYMEQEGLGDLLNE